MACPGGCRGCAGCGGRQVLVATDVLGTGTVGPGGQVTPGGQVLVDQTFVPGWEAVLFAGLVAVLGASTIALFRTP